MYATGHKSNREQWEGNNTNSMGQSMLLNPCWETNSSWTGQGIPHISWTLKFHYAAHKKSSLLIPVMSQINKAFAKKREQKNWNSRKITHQNYENLPRNLRNTYGMAQFGVQCGQQLKNWWENDSWVKLL